MFKYRDHEVLYVANRGWITRDENGEVTHDGLESLEAAVEQIIHDTGTKAALEIVRKLREVADISTGLLYSRRSMLIDAATTIEALTKPATVYQYRIEVSADAQGHIMAGRDKWVCDLVLPEGTTLEHAKDFLRIAQRSTSAEKADFYRLTRRPVMDWSAVE